MGKGKNVGKNAVVGYAKESRFVQSIINEYSQSSLIYTEHRVALLTGMISLSSHLQLSCLGGHTSSGLLAEFSACVNKV